MPEQESECHFCYFCGADDVSAPFSKSVDGNYVCPECQSKNSILMEDEILPCFCGEKPRVDRRHLFIGCPRHCVEYVGSPWEDFSDLIKHWNDWVSYNKEYKDELF